MADNRSLWLVVPLLFDFIKSNKNVFFCFFVQKESLEIFYLLMDFWKILTYYTTPLPKLMYFWGTISYVIYGRSVVCTSVAWAPSQQTFSNRHLVDVGHP